MKENLIKNYIQIRDELKKNINKSINFKADTIRKGHDLEKLVLSEPADLPMTPYLKTALVQSGELADNDQADKKIKLAAKPQKAELNIIEDTKIVLYEIFGKDNVEKELQSNPDLSYDRTRPINDPQHYLVDCLRNWKKMGREITPGTWERRMEALDKYGKQLKEIKYIDLLKFDKVFQAAVSFVMDIIPSVVSQVDMHVTAQPFMNKHTNVGYPYFRNDKTKDKDGRTFAEITLADAKTTSMEESIHYPAAIIGRDQRSGWSKEKNSELTFKDSKARPVYAVSRIPNLHFSRLQRPETDALREKSIAFWGFKGSNEASPLRKKNQDLLLNNFKDYVEENFDVAAYDTSVSLEDQLMRGAIAMEKVRDAQGKKIAKYRAIMAASMRYIDPRNGEVKRLIGRQASGFSDTNEGDGIIMLPKVVYVMALLDRDWIKNATKLINLGGSPIEVMGDDLRIMHRKDMDVDKFKDMMLTLFNFEIHPNKGEYGTFFVQERTIDHPQHGKIMVIPFPRAISKTFWVERPKGLGPFGWTVATYMKLQNLQQWPEVFNAVVRLIAARDKYKLGTEIDGKRINFAKFMSELKKEDALAQSEGKTSTADKLYDGDPNKVGDMFTKEGAFERNFLKNLFDKVSGALSG